jgi:hypothetical protein
MHTKLVEIRDAGTCITALAIRLDAITEAERYLLARAGYGQTREAQRGYVLLLTLAGGSGEVHCDPYDWPNAPRVRTMFVAQQYVNQHFDTLESGQVIDCEFILGETPAPKDPERLTHVQT